MKLLYQVIICVLVAILFATLFASYTANNGAILPLSFDLMTVVPFFLCALAAVLIADWLFPSKRSGSSSDEGSSGREQGEVKWFNVNKGFGFITRDSGGDIFVHFRSIRGQGRRSLKDGQRVEYDVVDSSKGLQAEDVSPV